MQLPSALLENAVAEFSKLPGIGKKTALRLVLHLLKQEASSTNQFSEALIRMRKEIQFCKNCFNISDGPICSICSNTSRSKTIQGDTTIYYIQKKMTGNACKVTTIARGIAFGGELEYADEMTLGKSISNRQPIQQYIK